MTSLLSPRCAMQCPAIRAISMIRNGLPGPSPSRCKEGLPHALTRPRCKLQGTTLRNCESHGQKAAKAHGSARGLLACLLRAIADAGTRLPAGAKDQPRPPNPSPLLRRSPCSNSVSYTHLRAHETPEHLVCR